MLVFLEGVLVRDYLQKGRVTKIKRSQGKKLVYPHANEYGTSLERKGELDHITAIRMKCVKKQKRQQKEIKDLAKA